MKTNIEDIRRDYKQGALSKTSLNKNPFLQFGKWLEDAIDKDSFDPTAFSLSTVNSEGRPSSRILLLKKFDESGFVFYTNYLGQKGRDLESNPFSAMLFFWEEFERQIRIEGKVEKITQEESEKYFKTRPYTSRIGAWASKQSEVLNNRASLIKEAAKYMIKFPIDVPLPEFWGGYRLVPDKFEFWQGRESRMHDRFQYKLINNQWIIDRLFP